VSREATAVRHVQLRCKHYQPAFTITATLATITPNLMDGAQAMSETFRGADGTYVPGQRLPQSGSDTQAAEQPANLSAPVSQADNLFQPARQIKDMLETKRILRKDVARICNNTDGYYDREHARLVAAAKHINDQLEALQARFTNGPAMLERLDRETAELETKLKITEEKELFNKMLGYMQTIAQGQQP
jgi:hypothetical protein